ncbi:MAG: DUF4058 family protein [Planctomycetota bacterium]|nr:DUF4058 family protein [Planctomycetota bacterium]
MPNPFPGIDPYIEWEGYWPDFHARFVNYWCETLVGELPDNYDARLNERVNLIEYHPARGKLIGPDVAILQREPTWKASPVAAGGVATLEPTTLPLVIESEETRETYIEVYHRPDETLVAVLELLSPSNKSGADRRRFLDKRAAVLRHNVHLVELDLLIGGERLPVAGRLPPGHFYAFVSRFTQRPYCDAFAWRLPDLLPAIPIPLMPPDHDVCCDLTAVFSQTYERGRYARTLQHDLLPDPALDDDTRRWITSRQAHCS